MQASKRKGLSVTQVKVAARVEQGKDTGRKGEHVKGGKGKIDPPANNSITSELSQKRKQAHGDPQMLNSYKRLKKSKTVGDCNKGNDAKQGDASGAEIEKTVNGQKTKKEAAKERATNKQTVKDGETKNESMKEQNAKKRTVKRKSSGDGGNGKNNATATTEKIRKLDPKAQLNSLNKEKKQIVSSTKIFTPVGKNDSKKSQITKVKSGAADDKKNLSSVKTSSSSPQKSSVDKSGKVVKGKKSESGIKEKTAGSRKHGKQQDKPQKPKSDKRKPSEAPPPPLDPSDPMAMLMMMEGLGGISSQPGPSSVSKPVDMSSVPSTSAGHTSVSTDSDDEQDSAEGMVKSMTDTESEGMSDWEEVHNHHVPTEKSQLPSEPVEITLDMPDVLKHKKRKKKAFDWKLYLERRVRRFKKDIAMDMHKVHLLCLLSLGLRQNDVLNDPTLKAVILSLLPAEFTIKTKLSEERQVENLLLWYKRKFPLESISHCTNISLVSASMLTRVMSKGVNTDARLWVLLFISILRAVGLTVRLVLSFQPMPFKVSQELSEKKPKGNGKPLPDAAKMKKKSAPKPKLSASTKASGKSSTSSSKYFKEKEKKSSSTSEISDAPERLLSRRDSSKKAALKTKKAFQDDSADEDDDYKDEDVRFDGYVDDPDSELSEEELKMIKEVKRKKKITKRITTEEEKHPSSENEFEDSSFCYQSPSSLKKDLKILSNRKVLSPSTSDDESSRRRVKAVGHDFWLEIFVPSKQKWLCFDCFRNQFAKPHTLENSATQPLCYVVGFKNDGSVKDVTARYAKQWLSQTRKFRVEPEWWDETLFAFDNTPHKENLMEDDEIKGQLLVRPMPTSIADFKSHPLYALRRHLLKFEAIYPDTAIPLGYIRKEPVYARECVRTLHSRDNWLKEGRLVRLNEQPYKMVKSRPKWNKPKENPDELDLQLFGEWQTEKYIPPPAYKGKVPKNEYGNVELFKPWMLPGGTVQIRGEGLKRVAKKLDIDIAPAMIGWDHHSGHAHPVMDGWIVCEEFADTLMAAWDEDQEIQKQREIERREKRVYGNWKLLIRGLLIKERLKGKFLQEAPKLEKAEKVETFSDGEEALDVHHFWPQNRKDEVKEKKTKADLLKKKRDKEILEKGSGKVNNVNSDDVVMKEDVDAKPGIIMGKNDLPVIGSKNTPSANSKKSKASSKTSNTIVKGRGRKNVIGNDDDDFEDVNRIEKKKGEDGDDGDDESDEVDEMAVPQKKGTIKRGRNAQAKPKVAQGGKRNGRMSLKAGYSAADDEDFEVSQVTVAGAKNTGNKSARRSSSRKAKKPAIVESDDGNSEGDFDDDYKQEKVPVSDEEEDGDYDEGEEEIEGIVRKNKKGGNKKVNNVNNSRSVKGIVERLKINWAVESESGDSDDDDDMVEVAPLQDESHCNVKGDNTSSNGGTKGDKQCESNTLNLSESSDSEDEVVNPAKQEKDIALNNTTKTAVGKSEIHDTDAINKGSGQAEVMEEKNKNSSEVTTGKNVKSADTGRRRGTRSSTRRAK